MMASESKRKVAEIAHGHKIVENAELIWGWDSPAGRRRAVRRAELLLERIEQRPDGPVLEIGCGSGVFTRKLAADLPNLVAIDLSTVLLQRASSMSEFTGYCGADAELLPFSDGQFAAVVGSSVIHHLEIGRVLSELWRVLKPGGRIAFAEPNMLNPQILLQKNIPALKERLGDSPDETAFVRWTLARRLLRLGFTDIVIHPYDFLHPLVLPALIPVVDKLGRIMERVPVVREIAGSLIISGQKR